MPRAERPLDTGDSPVLRLAAELRSLREKAGSPTYRELAERAHYSVATLAAAAAGRKLPSLAVTLAYVRACDGEVEEWERQWHSVAAELAVETDPPNGKDSEVAPYIGLMSFQPADAERFFGRERLVDELVDRLAQRRFIAVFGASGSGKSSLLRAGLIPRLKDVVLFTPGARPLEECAIQLAHAVGSTPGQLHAELAADPRNLHRVLRQAGRETVLVVDQFEEVFTLCHDPAERERFLHSLVTAASADNSCCRIVLGVRADFYSHCTDYPELVEALRDAQMAVGPLTTDELRRAIVQPAVGADCTVEGSLLATLIAQATGQAGVLPLLSHALLETWRRRRGNTLTLAGFQAVGGIDGALAQTAETLYRALDPRQQNLARSLLLRLTEPGEGTADTKRRIDRGELDWDDADLGAVVDMLAAARLLTLAADTVELAHESLLSAWPRLRDWLAESREELRIHRRLTEAAASWEELGKEDSALYRGTRLSVARDWAAGGSATLTARERKFLDASKAAEERERTVARRGTRRRHQLVALLAVVFLLATAATIVAIRAQDTATRQRDIATSQRLVAEGSALRATNPALATQFGLAAYRIAPTAESRGNLLSSFSAPYPAVLVGHNAHLESVAYSTDGHTVATSGQDRTARLWDNTDPRNPKDLATLTGHADNVCRVAFSPDGHILATASDDHTARLWDITNPSKPGVLATITGHTLGVRSVAFSPDGHLLATTGNDHTTRLWNITNPREPQNLSTWTSHEGMVIAAAFSPNGHLLATASDDHTARLWDISNPSQPVSQSTVGHSDIVFGVAFSPDGRTLATASNDHTARLSDITNPQQPGVLATITGHADTVRSVAFSSDGRMLATASNDHTAQVWDINDLHQPKKVIALAGHTDFVSSVAFSPDGRTLVTGSDDHTARVWDIPGPVISHGDFVFGVAFSPDGHTLATVSQDHTARLWDITNPQQPSQLSVLIGHTDNVYGVAFSPDGHTLATTSEDLTTRLWNVTNLSRPSQLSVLNGHTKNPEGVAFSPDGRILVTTGQDHTARLWDITNLWQPEVLAVLTGHTDNVRSATFSPDGHTLATTSDDHTARLWDVTQPRQTSQLAVLTGHIDIVRSAAFSPDGHTLATASDDHTARLWDVTDLRQPGVLAVLTGHTDHVESVAYSRDGHTLATGSRDDTARLWDVSNPQQPAVEAVLTGHTDRIHRVAFSPDGHTLATTSRDKTARLWETDIDRVIAHICDTAHPIVGEAEWAQYFPDLAYQSPCP